MERGLAQQRFMHFQGLAVSVVVADQVQLHAIGDGAPGELEESQELLVAVALAMLGDHRAAGPPDPRDGRPAHRCHRRG